MKKKTRIRHLKKQPLIVQALLEHLCIDCMFVSQPVGVKTCLAVWEEGALPGPGHRGGGVTLPLDT